MSTRHRLRISHLLVAAILGVLAFTLVLIVTDPPGPGLDPDAMAYLGAAQSVAHGAGYRIPAAGWRRPDSSAALTHFPPGYSTALALPVRLGMAPPQAARLIQAVAAAITVGTTALLVAGATTVAAGALAGVALLAMPAMALVHLSVLSEPLFLACTILVLAAMAAPRPRPVRTGVAAALGALTRYAGLALVGAAMLWAMAEPGTARERLRRALLALLPAALLQGAWMLRTRLLHEPAEIRRLALYGRLGPTLVQGGATLRDWLVPDPDAWSDPLPYRPALALAVAFVVTSLVVLGTRSALAGRRDPARTVDAPPAARAPLRLLAASALVLACYLGLLLVSRLLADPGIPFDERILAPALLVATVAIATATAVWWRATPRVLPRVALAVALCGWAVAAAATTGQEAAYALDWGSDFAGEQWRRSELLDWARTAGATHPLYSNWPAAVYFHLHRAGHYIPTAREGAAALGAFADTLRARDGRALVFASADVDYLTVAQLRAAPGLEVVAELEDGLVLRARPR